MPFTRNIVHHEELLAADLDAGVTGVWVHAGRYLIRTGPQSQYNVRNCRAILSLLSSCTQRLSPFQLESLQQLRLCEETLSLTQILQASGINQEDTINGPPSTPVTPSTPLLVPSSVLQQLTDQSRSLSFPVLDPELHQTPLSRVLRPSTPK